MHRRFPLLTAALLVAVAPGWCWSAQGPIRLAEYDGTIRVACVGDSITAVGGSTSYPALLGKLLGRPFEVRNFGSSGAAVLKKANKPYWGTAELRQAIAFAPHVVIIMLGTNDSKAHNWEHGSHFTDDLEALVERFTELDPKPRIWMCLPVPAFGRSYKVNETTLRFRVVPKIRQVAARKGLPTIDLQNLVRLHPEYFPDKVHPNRDGRAYIARLVYAAIRGKKAPTWKLR
jgi:lysophospholipase L1-like esterase